MYFILTGNLDVGVYIVSVTGENGERITKQIVKANQAALLV
jgi:hypothetical protein